MNTFLKTVKNSIKHWYLLLISGLIFIAVGFFVFMSPLESYATLSFLFSISFLMSGLLEVYFSIANRSEVDGWGWNLVFGLITVVVGVQLIAHPEITMVTLPLYIGFLLMFRSIMGIGYALELKNYGVLDWGNIMIVAVLGLIFSYILIWNPVFAGSTMVVWTALSLIAGGIFSIFIALKLKKLKNKTKIDIDEQ